MPPLKDILVLDFSTLLPGPMATLFLADAGAQVIKIERPPTGDDMRLYQPAVNGEGINFAMLNRGKSSLSINIKEPGALDRLRPLLEKADIIVEQFRPGVMARLGLGYEDILKINPDIIYCSINGWGSTGPKSTAAGHDLNYMAETGVLGLSVDGTGGPILPPILAADIAAGAYPAMINMLLALRQRDRTKKGCWIEVAMGENLFPFLYWALGNAHALDQWPAAGGETVTGGSPRYQIYRTRDNRHLAAAPLEDKFWANFTKILKLPPELVDDSLNPQATRDAIAQIIISRDAADWMAAFEGVDVCCSLVLTLQEAMQDPHWSARGVFSKPLTLGDKTVPALPSIICPELRDPDAIARSPELGELNT
ncbi:CoA transferase [Paenalcaligenes niemegkensis]|uniref:CaiB/BaiF CoA transferase family protein n=1 Tax=Paenalcaligenes niemegkensis TaxID=2895469 RepID=UPI001EE85891|nr:CaiB/BaiF CoA-transferase family protein [Paenalcaligenes niemegkensis]MCQ9615450.1 CoA transferase [Paenalcaligenes niemegkensis]